MSCLVRSHPCSGVRVKEKRLIKFAISLIQCLFLRLMPLFILILVPLLSLPYTTWHIFLSSWVFMSSDTFCPFSSLPLAVKVPPDDSCGTQGLGVSAVTFYHRCFSYPTVRSICMLRERAPSPLLWHVDLTALCSIAEDSWIVSRLFSPLEFS